MDYSRDYSHWNAERSLSDWLKSENIPALTGIDTRALTKRLREKGTMLGKVVFRDDVPFYDPNRENLISRVTTPEPVVYNPEGSPSLVLSMVPAPKNPIPATTPAATLAGSLPSPNP